MCRVDGGGDNQPAGCESRLTAHCCSDALDVSNGGLAHARESNVITTHARMIRKEPQPSLTRSERQQHVLPQAVVTSA